MLLTNETLLQLGRIAAGIALRSERSSLGRVGRVVTVFRSDGEDLGAGQILSTYVGRERWAR